MNRPPLYKEAKAMVVKIKDHLGSQATCREWVGVQQHPNKEMSLQTDIYIFPQQGNSEKEKMQITNTVYGKLGGDFTIAGPKVEFILEHGKNNQTSWKTVLIYRLVLKERYPYKQGMTANYKLYI